ncbi:MAG: DUF4386 domain-containing protein [Bacteroidota bacterium]
MKATKKSARIAGLLYLLMAITGAFGILYVPSNIIVHGDVTQTANNIITSESLFRMGIVSYLICQASFVFVVLALYHLLKGVNGKLALLMLALVIVAIPIAFLNMLNQIAALILLSGVDSLQEFEPEQLNSLVMVFLKLHEQGIYIVQIFWGLWLFPFGLLVYKSGFIPRVLGILLMIACFGYMVDSFAFLLYPHVGDIISPYATVPSAIGEFSIILWLLIKGVKG